MRYSRHLKSAISILIFFTMLALLSSCASIQSAAETGDINNINKIKSLLEKGADINAKDKYGCTALMWAARYGNTESIKFLLDKGADINKDGVTSLIWAVFYGHTEAVRLLIDKGADVDMAIEGLENSVVGYPQDTRYAVALKQLKRIKEKQMVAIVKPQAEEKITPQKPLILSSDVDIDIPKTNIQNPSAIAVVIGNKDYKNKDVPSVDFALNDASAMKNYLLNVLGYKEGNIIYRENASKGDFESVFGTEKNHEGSLYDYLIEGKSDIFIYYSGHGAPDPETKQGYFVPSDADPQRIALTGYPIKWLYDNISKTVNEKKTPNVFIIIDACFSGATEKGLLLKNVSPLVITMESVVMAIPNSVVMTSSAGTEVSSWYPEKAHSMFTYFFLKALKEKAEKGEGIITAETVFASIIDKIEGVPYWARRLNGRVQTPQLMGDDQKVLFRK